MRLIYAVIIFILLCVDSFSAVLPTAPQTYIDTTYSLPTGTIRNCSNASEFATALTDSALGDIIVLTAGTTYTGPFTLPNKTSGSGWIYITSSAYSSLPQPGSRVSVSDATNMPKIAIGTGYSTINTANSAHHFRFVGIEFKPTSNNYVNCLISLGNADVSTSTLPTDIIFDRCYIHGDPTQGGRRGMAMDGIRVAIIDSYISGFKETGADSQALWAYNTPGPIKIVNNYLEAASENVLFGGKDPYITNCIPSDIEIKRNHFFKPLSWISESINVKNLLEFKNAQRVLVEGNTLENNWVGADQSGWAILITPRNQDGTAEWCTTKDISIKYNKIINVVGGFEVAHHDTDNTSAYTYRIQFSHNIFKIETVNEYIHFPMGIFGGPNDLTITNNTFLNSSTTAAVGDNPLEDTNDLNFVNNIFGNGTYGFKGAGVNGGTPTLNEFFTSYTFTKNAIYDGGSGGYPDGNCFPANIAAVKFVDYAGGNYRLANDSDYKAGGSCDGTDDRDLGADITALELAMGISSSTASVSVSVTGGSHTITLSGGSRTITLP